MHTLTTVEDIDGIIGTPPAMILLKVTDTLDDGSRSILAAAPAAALGYRDTTGAPRTTVVGGTPGFARVETATRLSFPLPEGTPEPAPGAGASMVFLLPGLGETFRLNGAVTALGDGHVAVDVQEAYLHCARCVLRSGLWTAVPGAPSIEATVPDSGPLARPGVAAFLATSPFAVISSRDADERADTSPRGDGPGLVTVLDGETVVLAERRGNKRADTLHNIVTCPDVSLAAFVPGRDEIVTLSGTARVDTDPALLATMALRGQPPPAAVVVHVEHAELVHSAPVDALWNGPRPDRLPDVTAMAAAHVAANGGGGRAGRLLTRGLAAVPRGLTRRAMDAAYRSSLRGEGY